MQGDSIPVRNVRRGAALDFIGLAHEDGILRRVKVDTQQQHRIHLTRFLLEYHHIGYGLNMETVFEVLRRGLDQHKGSHGAEAGSK